ncbi:dynamin family protein [Corynebacterium aquatimens]|uniref:GTP-binding protein EngB required for normal cell division/archaellum component FlaC n=1 Tax=Corynebacterium aquatimens TaxID=1190508 RepID=A0A931DV85_9CORY|nr:dynamin family protein [Corynebacterium aquatimens]MBG6122139.1 GTP-binding protein EngB required for normal cell division/archaellum component FlaC [Corynebacterium aquatimens]
MSANTQSTGPQRTARQSLDRAADIARRYGKTQSADLAQSLVGARFRTGSVVVVGEIKRGKSSLVNALVGKRGLLPVDVLTSTSAPIRVALAAPGEGSATPRVEVVRGEERLEVSPEQLGDYVTIDGISGGGTGSDDNDLVSAAEVQLENADLAGMTVVDTPGVGGLDEYAVRAAFNEAHEAGVLLMVCDASTPITKPEMEILDAARARVGAVVVAVTKTDKNVRRWKAIVEDDRRLIRENLGADVPVVGVSSLRALDAIDEADPARRAEIERRSGITELRAQLKGVLKDPETMGMISGLDSIAATLAGIRKEIDQDLELVAQPNESVDKLEAEYRELENLKEHAAEWEQLLARDIQLMRNRITEDLDSQVEQLRNNWTHRINNDGMRVLRSKPQVFTSQIEAELTETMRVTLARQFDGLQERAVQLFPNQPDTVHAVTQAAVLSIAPEDVTGRDVEKKTKDIFDPSMVSVGVIGSTMLAVIIPFAPLAGAMWVGVHMGFRALRNGKTHLIQWLREITQTTRSTTVRMLDTMITAARTEMVLRYRAQLRQRTKTVQEHITQARNAARESESERKQKVTRLQKNHAIVSATIEELSQHAARLRAGGRDNITAQGGAAHGRG